MISKVKIFLTRNSQPKNDDLINITSDGVSEFFTIKYIANDLSRARVFQMSERDTMSYVSDIFKSLDYDMDPFDKVQITTAIHPSIMYDTAILGDTDVRHRIEDMIRDALRLNVNLVK